MTAHIYTDGASRNNPGQAAYGVWVNELGRASWGEGLYLGDDISNETAEFRAVIRGIEIAIEIMAAYDVTGVVLHTDSNNTVKYLSGEYQVRAAHHVPLYEQAVALRASAPKPLQIKHVMREANCLADKMANEALDARGAVSSRHEYSVLADVTPVSQTKPPAVRKAKRRKA